MFIILHYKAGAINDTFECVASVEKLSQADSAKIIIVDNGSHDGSAERLLDRYRESANVIVLPLESNRGFAQGNNHGCRYAIENYSPEFLIVINNDTVINQDNFLGIVEDAYAAYSFHICGPNILDLRGLPQNPVSVRQTIEEVERSIDYIETRIQVIRSSRISYAIRYKMFPNLRRILSRFTLLYHIYLMFKPRKKKSASQSHEIGVNIPLHGAALVFSRKYYAIFPDIFDPRTFLFCEEDILFYRVKSNNLVSIYYPELRIIHKEDQSTKALLSSSKERELFILAEKLKSFHVLKQLFDGCR